MTLEVPAAELAELLVLATTIVGRLRAGDAYDPYARELAYHVERLRRRAGASEASWEFTDAFLAATIRAAGRA